MYNLGYVYCILWAQLDGANTPNMTHLHDLHHLLLLDTAILVNVIETECHSQLVLRFA